MKTVTYEEFLKLDPCWLEYEGGKERIKAYFDRFGGRMSALDILNLDDVSEEDRLWAVLREEFIPAPILHEFACVYAEYALSLIKNPDPRSVNAIKVKRAWLRGEATDEELAAARDAACDAYDAAWKVAYAAARYDARSAAWAPDVCAAKAARRAASDALDADWDVGCADARYTQVAYLIMALEGEDGEGSAKCEAQVTYSIMPSEGKMKTVTYEEFLEFDPCWLEGEDGEGWIKVSFDRFGGRMSALDILSLDGVREEDKLWSVLREEFIPAPILHEFACVCAEYALTLIDNPDPRSIKAVEVKRAWMRGEATDGELDTARAAAREAARVAVCKAKAARDAACGTAWVARAARDVAWTASDAVGEDAGSAAWTAGNDAASAASDAWSAASAASAASADSRAAASDAAYEAQVAYLIMTLEEEV